MMLVVLALGGTALVIGLITDASEREAIGSVADSFITQLNLNVISRATEFIGIASRTSSAYVLRMGLSDSEYMDAEFQRKSLFEYGSLLPPWFDGVYFADVQGGFFAIFGITFCSRVAPVQGPPLPKCADDPLWVYSVDYWPNGTLIGNLSCGWSNYNTTDRPWYKLITNDPRQVTKQNQTRQVWSDLYLYSNDKIGYTLSQGLWKKNIFIGVTAIDVTVETLSKFLGSQYVTKNTVLYIRDGKGYMVATRSAIVLTNNGNPYRVSDWPESIVRELDAAVGAANNKGVSRTTIGDTTYFTAATVMDPQGQENLDWHVIIGVPESDFMEIAIQGRITALYSWIAVIFVILFISLGLAYFVHRPMQQLLYDTEQVATMSVDDIQVQVSSRVSEVYRLQISFQKMVLRLRQYKDFIPKTVFATDDGDEETEVLIPTDIPNVSAVPVVRNHSTEGAHSSSGASRSTEPTTPVFRKHTSFLRVWTVNRVCVLTLNMQNTHTLVHNDVFADTHATNTSIALSAITRHKGVPVLFFGDHLLVAFNSVTRVAAKGYHACMTALEVIKDTTDFPSQFSAGISMGLAHCGDAGVQGMRAYGIVGPVINESIFLQRLTKKFKTRALISGTMYAECMSDFVLLTRDILFFSKSVTDTNEFGTLIAMELSGKVEDNKRSDHSEWMYTLEDKGLFHEFTDTTLRMLSSNNTSSGQAFVEKYADSAIDQHIILRDEMARLVKLLSIPPVVENYYQ
jgi:hypothetical protein